MPRRREKLREADLAGGADHAEAHHAAQLRGLNLDRVALAVPLHPRSWLRYGNELRGGKIHAAADDRRGRGVAHVHRADAQLIGVGMRFHGQDTSHYEPREIIGETYGVFNLHRRHRQII